MNEITKAWIITLIGISLWIGLTFWIALNFAPERNPLITFPNNTNGEVIPLTSLNNNSDLIFKNKTKA